MNQLSLVFRNRAFWLFIVIYLVCFLVLIASGLALEDVLGSLVILGVILPLLALATCWRLPTPGLPSTPRPGEPAMLIVLLVFVAIFLAVKGSILGLLLGQNPNPRLQEAMNTALKLVAFVGIPAAVLRWHHGKWPETGRVTAPASRLWFCFVVLSAAGIAVQLLLGSQVKRLFGGNYADRHLLLGVILCFVWMIVEAGLVEEFFFRWLLQSRIAAITGSQLSAIFLMALAFGLAHAPGIWLRGAGVAEGLGAAPSLLTSVAYSVTSQGVAGLMFGVLWARTRSFPLIVLLHAVLDTPANTARFMDLWGL